MQWVKNPIIYEIHTWVWLNELSRRHGKKVTLGSVPAKEWDTLKALGIDAVWFMGVWERSPEGIRVANENAEFQAEFRRALPDFQPSDNVGSAYCVRDYVVAQALGGPSGLAKARQALATRGIRLILDFVPNHVAPDHPWATLHPEYFIRGSREDLERAPGEFFQAGEHVIANGRDPYFAPWPDVVQLNAFDPGLREAAIRTVNSIADQCDGMRCDMAMLMLNAVFARTWGERAGNRPETEYWTELISRVRTSHPDVIFIAEAYWDLEWELQQKGFDYCYDKRLYDRLEHESAQSVVGHLRADMAYQQKLVRFIENHDEPRAAGVFAPQRERAAAVIMATIPGAKLYYDGQFEGRRIKVPVFLARRADEASDAGLEGFYRALLKATHTELIRSGTWQLCEVTGWSDNQSCLNLLAWCWARGDERNLIIVNWSDTRSQGRVRLPWHELTRHVWGLHDVLSGALYERLGAELVGDGLYVDLGPGEFHLINFV